MGGCVRDSLLGRTPNDWDITTSALPAQIKSIFRHSIDTGIEHGTVTVLINKEAFEITTFRRDSEYTDHRHPSSVDFVTSLTEDLRRRDFTINAMAYNDADGLVDPFNGRKDLADKRIRCVGNPMDRFAEDALRMLRAIRFSAQLSFEIDPETREAIKAHSAALSHISAERICTELIKLLVSPHPEYMRTAYELGMTNVFFPEFDTMMETPQKSKYHLYSVGEHTIKTMENIDADRILRLTMLVHDIGKPSVRFIDKNGNDHFYGHAKMSEQMAKNFMRRLNMDNDTIKKVALLVRYHDWRFAITPAKVRYAVSVVGKDLFPSFIKVQRADSLGKSDYGRAKTLENINKIQKIYNTIIGEDQCVSVKELNISGSDIIDLGCPPGPKIGELLNKALDIVLDDPAKNDSTYLIEYIKHLLTEESHEHS